MTPTRTGHVSTQPAPAFAVDSTVEEFIARFSSPDDSKANLSPKTLGRRQQVLRIAEAIDSRIRTATWTDTNWPTLDQAAAELAASPKHVAEAQDLLAWRGILTKSDSEHSAAYRPVPLQELAAHDISQRMANRIAMRIRLGIWSGSRFPTIRDIARELGSGSNGVSLALQLLREEGMVHKVMALKAGVSGRTRRWCPTDMTAQPPETLIPALETALRAGDVTGILPRKREMARRCRVAVAVTASGYDHLERQGLIARGWIRGVKSPIWFATLTGAPRGVLPGKTKPLAIAAAIIRCMPDWLVDHGNGQWSRTLLPASMALRDEYATDNLAIDRALQILVEMCVLERAPLASARYLPRRPADNGAAYGLNFQQRGRAGRRWTPAGEPVEWRPLPDPDHRDEDGD